MKNQFPSQHGFSMIEVLVTLVILAFGILGLAGMQSVGLKNSQASLHRSQASLVAYDIIDRMRSNCLAARGGDYNITLSAATPTANSTMAQSDLNQWRTSISSEFASGKGAVAVDLATLFATVTVQWDDSRATGGNATQQVVVGGALPSLATCSP